MTKGHVFLAQNSDTDYVRQAYALALSIKTHNKIHNQTCLITNDTVPESYRHAFDHIVKIPWGDLAYKSYWKIENRTKIIHATPFDENLVYDVDMLLLNSNDHWWQYFKDDDLLFTANVKTYRENQVTENFYRKTFTANQLDNIYSGCFYFKKSATSYEFFKWLSIIVGNWENFYKEHLKNSPQKFCSIDVSAALAIKFMDCKSAISNKILTFTHMKPKIQGWYNPPDKWTSVLASSLDNSGLLKVGNFQQHGIFHYVEDEFLTDSKLDTLEKIYREQYGN
jgi:hypothetical protein